MGIRHVLCLNFRKIPHALCLNFRKIPHAGWLSSLRVPADRRAGRGVAAGRRQLIQRRSFRNALTILEEEVWRLGQTAATGAEEIHEAMAQRGQAVQALQVAHAAKHEELHRTHDDELQSLKAAHVKALEEARTELSIVSLPYESTTGDEGWIVDDRISEIGYQYQLFVRSVPCFDPHKVITQRIEKKEVNQQKIAGLKDEVAGPLATIASRHPAFQVARKFVTGSKARAH